MQFAMTAPPVLLAPDESVPDDLKDVVGDRGDSFRDDFTRICLYLAQTAGSPAGSPADHVGDADGDLGTVVVGTTYGNAEAMARICRLGDELGRRLSAQYFTNALTSSAGAFVNMSVGATGRNMTLSSGALTPVMAFWHLLLALRSEHATRSCLLLGDVYSPEALDDVRRNSPASSCRPGVLRAQVRSGDTYQARFDFSGRQDAGAGTAAGRVTVDDTVVYADDEHNTAFAGAEFFRRVLELDDRDDVTLTCVTPVGRSASVSVTRSAPEVGQR